MNSSSSEIADKKNPTSSFVEKLDIVSLYKTSKENRRRVKEERALNVILGCSRVIDEMPYEFKQVLTHDLGTSVTITPQQSFVTYFKKYKPKFEGEDFHIRFVEIFASEGGSALHTMKRNKLLGRSAKGNDDFWRIFEVLFYGMENSENMKNKENLITKQSVWLSSFLRSLRVIKKMIFTGTPPNFDAPRLP